MSMTVREQQKECNTLVSSLSGTIGHNVIVELRNDTTVAGKLENVEPIAMNLSLSDVTFIGRDEVTIDFDIFYVQGKNIRYVQIPDEIDMLATIERRVIVETEFVVSGTQCSVGMGRLMDSVMAALGLKPSDRVQISSSAPEKWTERKTPPQKQEDKPLSPEMEKLIEELENRPQNRRDFSVFPFGSIQLSPPNDKKEKQENKEKDATNVDKIVPDVEKKEENEYKDCLGCKVVRVGSCAIGVGCTLYTITANTWEAKGLKLLRIRIGGIGVILSLTGIGVITAFDLNKPSEEERIEQSKRGPLEQINFELKYLGDLLGISNKVDKKLDDASKDTDKS